MCGELLDSLTDPLKSRISGALLSGGKSKSTLDDRSQISPSSTFHNFTISTFTSVNELNETPQTLFDNLDLRSPSNRPAHIRWWANFWSRSWFKMTPRNDNTTLTTALNSAFTLNRYLSAIQGRGNLPIHHNGGGVTWGWNGSTHENPDLRPWAGGYWFQVSERTSERAEMATTTHIHY